MVIYAEYVYINNINSAKLKTNKPFYKNPVVFFSLQVQELDDNVP